MNAVRYAFAALSPFAFASLAQAQTGVNGYGWPEAGIVAARGCDGCAANNAAAGSDGVDAVFTLESALAANADRAERRGNLFGRQAYAGVDSRFGALTVAHSHVDDAGMTDLADPFQGGIVGTASNLLGYTSRRYDNTIKYETPTLRGLSAAALYSVGETRYSSVTNKAYGATVGYADGIVTLSVAYQRKYSMVDATAVVPAADNSARNTLVTANFNLGPAIAYVGYGRNKGQDGSAWDLDNPYGAMAQNNPSTDSRDALIGLAVPRGVITYLASYIHKDDRSLMNQDANQVALGLTYAMSKHTGIYAAYARIFNRNGAAYTVGNEGERGRGSSAVNLGLRHSF